MKTYSKKAIKSLAEAILTDQSTMHNPCLLWHTDSNEFTIDPHPDLSGLDDVVIVDENPDFSSLDCQNMGHALQCAQDMISDLMYEVEEKLDAEKY